MSKAKQEKLHEYNNHLLYREAEKAFDKIQYTFLVKTQQTINIEKCSPLDKEQVQKNLRLTSHSTVRYSKLSYKDQDQGKIKHFITALKHQT